MLDKHPVNVINNFMSDTILVYHPVLLTRVQLHWYSENMGIDDKLFETLAMLKVNKHYW